MAEGKMSAEFIFDFRFGSHQKTQSRFSSVFDKKNCDSVWNFGILNSWTNDWWWYQEKHACCS